MRGLGQPLSLARSWRLAQEAAAPKNRIDIDGARRASIAAIFRSSVDGEEQVLFIRRAINPRDPWSGHVALPGGRQDGVDNGDDEATAIREVREEVGLDLDGWVRLGRLVDDRLIHARGRPMVISLFGFEWEDSRGDTATADTLTPQPSEVADAWWVDTRLLRPERLGWRRVTLAKLLGPSATPLVQFLLHLTRCTHADFAAIDLPPPTTAPVVDPTAHQLWGITLAFLSDLCREALSTPLVGHGAARGFVEPYRAPGLASQLLLKVLFRVSGRLPPLKPGQAARLAFNAAAAAAAAASVACFYMRLR